MQTIFEMIREIFGLGQDIYRCVNMNEMRKMHKKFVARTIWILVLILVVMVTLNCFGLEKVNLVISLFLSVAAALILTRSEFLVATTATGVVSGVTQDPNAIKAELKKFFALHFRTVGDVILWTSVFGLFLGTISCEENPGAVLAIAVALIVIGYGSYRFNFTTGLYKKIVYNYAILVLIISLLSIVPAHTWIHWTGHDLGYFFHKSEMETALSKIEKTEREIVENKEKKALLIIERKIRNGEELSQIEKDFLEDMKRERERNSLPGIVSGKISSLIEAKAAAENEAKAKSQAETEIAAKKAEAERAAAEKAVKTVAAAAPQATPQAEVQPQKEVAKKVSPTKMLYFFDGEEKNNQIFVERFDSRTIEFVQTWKNGRKVFFSGQRSGDVFRGMYHFEDEPPQRNFVFNPQSMCGEFEQSEGNYISFRLL